MVITSFSSGYQGNSKAFGASSAEYALAAGTNLLEIADQGGMVFNPNSRYGHSAKNTKAKAAQAKAVTKKTAKQAAQELAASKMLHFVQPDQEHRNLMVSLHTVVSNPARKKVCRDLSREPIEIPVLSLWMLTHSSECPARCDHSPLSRRRAGKRTVANSTGDSPVQKKTKAQVVELF